MGGWGKGKGGKGKNANNKGGKGGLLSTTSCCYVDWFLISASIPCCQGKSFASQGGGGGGNFWCIRSKQNRSLFTSAYTSNIHVCNILVRTLPEAISVIQLEAPLRHPRRLGCALPARVLTSMTAGALCRSFTKPEVSCPQFRLMSGPWPSHVFSALPPGEHLEPQISQSKDQWAQCWNAASSDLQMEEKCVFLEVLLQLDTVMVHRLDFSSPGCKKLGDGALQDSAVGLASATSSRCVTISFIQTHLLL